MPGNQDAHVAGAARCRLDDAVIGEQIRLLLHKRSDLPINLVNAGIVSAVLWRLYPAWLGMTWLSLFAIVILARSEIRRRYRSAAPGVERARHWGRIFAWNAFATAFLWGLTGSVILVTSNGVYHVFIVFVLGGMLAGGIVSNGAYKPAMFAMILPAILPAILILLTRPVLMHIEMGVMLAMFAVVLIIAGRNINRSIVENFRLRIAQDVISVKLRASEAAMAEAQALAHVGSWEHDLHTDRYFWSPETFRIFQADPATSNPGFEIILARVHPDDRALVQKDYDKVLATGTGSGIEHRIVMDDGTIRFVHEIIQTTYDAQGRPLRVYGTVQDITERRSSEDKLQFANVLLTAETEASPDGILVVDTERTILSFNHRFAEIWKIPLADLAARNDGKVLAQVVSSVKNSQEFSERIEYLYAHPGEDSHEEYETNSGRFIDRYTVTLAAPGGEYLGRVWFFRDITGRKQVANALAYRDRLLHAVTVGTGILIKAASLDEGMPEALRILGESMQVDRVLAIEESAEGLDASKRLTLRYSWQAPGITMVLDSSAFIAPPSEVPAVAAWRTKLAEGQPVIAQLATSTGTLPALLERANCKSTLLMPVFLGDQLWGNLGIDACASAREWTDSEIDTLKTFADIIGSLILRNQIQLALQKSEERFRVLSATAQDAIITINGEGWIGSWNQGAERILGYSAAEAVGKQVHAFLAPDRFREKAGQGMQAFMSTGQGAALGKTVELAARRKDGVEIAVELSLAGAQLGGKWEAIGILRDITDRKRAEGKLQFANLLLTTEMEASPDGILVVDPNRKITSYNQRFADIWNIPLTSLLTGRDDIVLEESMSQVKDPQKVTALIQQLYEDHSKTAHDELETTDGRFIERHSVTLNTPAGEYLGRVWFFRDVTRGKQAAAETLRMARFDGLTGLANRSVFVEALQHAVAAAKRGGKGFAVIYLDLDHFKDVNDTLGHPVGDALLEAVADRLRLNTRETDTVARFGGDEFAVVVAEIGEPDDAAIVADKLIAALGEPYSIEGNDIYSGASIGIDIYGPESADAETLLSHADVALYRAKAEGRGGYRFFTDEMDSEVRMRVSLGTELHTALDSGQLFLLYQPQVAVESGRITGVEALLRWRHPRRGILNPDVFIPLAEKIGIMVKLGHWVLLTASRQAKRWFDLGGVPIRTSVNVSALQFKSPAALEADIAAILAETGLPPQLLELELTETALMNASREHSDIVPRFHRLGVTIAIDDFGTGYSSLDYLRRFPADRIKIAQTFVLNLETIRGDEVIVKAIISLARELGITVVAEGVETREQLELLKSWGCADVQGFYFARPLAAEDISNLLDQGGTLQPHDQFVV